MIFTLPTFIESNPGHGKRKKGDGTIPIDPEFPQKPADKEKPETEASSKEMKAAKRIEKELKKKERSEGRMNAKTGRPKDGS